MSKVCYLLSDGSIVYTYAEAVGSGQSFTTRYEPIPEPRNIFIPKSGDKRIKIR